GGTRDRRTCSSSTPPTRSAACRSPSSAPSTRSSTTARPTTSAVRTAARSSRRRLSERRHALIPIALTVNGVRHETEVEPRTLLVDYLRDELGLTGTKIGCDTSVCGSCTIHLDGHAVKSCTVLAVQADGCEVTTIEGLAHDGQLHPLQEAFWERHALQCGFCTPGMIMAGVELLGTNGDRLTDAEIRRGLEGNICRCTGYQHIVEAMHEAAVGWDGDPGRKEDRGSDRCAHEARRGPGDDHRDREVHRRSEAARDGSRRDPALAVRPRADQGHRHDEGGGGAGRGRRLHRQGLRASAAAAVRVAS